MTYSTVEAYVKDKEIIFSDTFSAPKKTMKVLVTFIEEDDNLDYKLYELDKSEVTEEMLEMIKETKKMPKSEFINL